ncbi:MAG: molybdenum cofactor guanylyltransferase [Gammaproteobacteria bacterium]|nr:MAG: molybdenum cofactor guanylyltransferase [Gammaproteobacteria bacterium]
MSDRPPITGGILAGGRGSRMGGVDKGLVAFAGRPLIEQVVQGLAPQVDHLVINANRNLDRYRSLGFPVVSDRLEGHQGPLAGFAALMHACEDPWLVTAPCDTPQIPPDLVARLWAACAAEGCRIAVAHDGQRLQPAHALLDVSLLGDLEDFLAAGERKIDIWYARHPMVTVDFSDRAEAFLNLNRPEDYQRFPEAHP